MYYNVLPEEVKQDLHKEYRLRRTTVGIFALSGIFCILALLLLPGLVVIDEKARQAESAVASAAGGLGTSAKDSASAVDFLGAKVQALSLPSAKALPSDLIEKVLAAAPEGVKIFSIAKDRSGAALIVSGVAETRAALVGYQETLKKTQPFTDANLPVALLAKDANVSFDLTVKGSF